MQTHESPQRIPPVPADGFFLSEAAARRINKLKLDDGQAGLRFRIGVKGGGCSGFQYDFSLDAEQPAEDDRIFGRDGAEVIIDETSLAIIRGAMLDYTEDLSHAGFEIKNPNAVASCGCGNSFSVAL